ncbi:hypothetical protein JW960_24900 [candidate division KSB1 bacterium]|nr:hypothetical protein [candidate division KSB1 bacterium]
MASMYELREQLISLRNSFRSQKGGLGNITAITDDEKNWLVWARDNSDRFRENLNSIIKNLDEIIGN